MATFLLILIIVAEIINIATYQYYRYLIGGRAQLRVIKKAKPGSKMTYLCPGMLMRSRDAFNFLIEKEGIIKGGITLVEYNQTGFNPRAIAKQISEDADELNYKLIAIGISVGDQIIRVLDEKPDEAGRHTLISINPCDGRSFLQKRWKTTFSILLPIAMVFSFVIGWVANFRLILGESPSSFFSLSLVLDQLKSIGLSDKNAGKIACDTDTECVVLSRRDEFVYNQKVLENYTLLNELNKIFVNSYHSDTVDSGDMYLAEMSKQLEEIYSYS